MLDEGNVQKLLDKEAIRELVNLYCRAADRHDHDLMRRLHFLLQKNYSPIMYMLFFIH